MSINKKLTTIMKTQCDIKDRVLLLEYKFKNSPETNKKAVQFGESKAKHYDTTLDKHREHSTMLDTRIDSIDIKNLEK